MSVAVRPPSVQPQTGAEGVSLAELIQRARNAHGEERAWLGSLVNKALASLPAAPDKDKQAQVLVAMLDDEALHDLEDDKKVPCRAVAVEALLTIGYPWALQLDPDDVQFLREHPAIAKTSLPLGQVFTGLAGVGAVGFLGVSLVTIPAWWVSQLMNSPAELALVGALVATIASAVPVVRGGPFLKSARWMMGLASAVAAAIIGSDALTHSASWIHALLMAIPLLGLVGALLREPPAPRVEGPPAQLTAG